MKADFGVAQLFEDNAQNDKVTTTAGTYFFMSPESFDKDAGK